ncbi:hypothetical protein BJ508DRAFT_851 [Ascobolus immersus RN42]|uniref:Uncharacterized protein n=1 Tax=Ascobolus immersus RN42 TaxID=1160509 RepID=A0A3N4IQH0_ASCIM|nr:hypothetical protein BJ508DRAFT_851 [Ascobolus immersus RN42]
MGIISPAPGGPNLREDGVPSPDLVIQQTKPPTWDPSCLPNQCEGRPPHLRYDGRLGQYSQSVKRYARQACFLRCHLSGTSHPPSHSICRLQTAGNVCTMFVRLLMPARSCMRQADSIVWHVCRFVCWELFSSLITSPIKYFYSYPSPSFLACKLVG